MHGSVRRATALCCRYDGADLIIENYLTGRQTLLPPQLFTPLGAMTNPVSNDEAVEYLGGTGADLLLERLLEQQLLLRMGSDLERHDHDVAYRWPWGHDVRFFHYSTRRTRFTYDLQHERNALVARARAVPQPPAFKDYGRDDIVLPQPTCPPVDFAAVLTARRTGRSFAPRPTTLADLATILHLTWGITDLRPDPEVGVIALKTSPSGGARHPIEVYCLAQNVADLKPGVYHYNAGRHTLARLRDSVPAAQLFTALTEQPWVAQAAAVFLMAAITTRSAWKYPQSHAYRVVLLDAGHLGQTFHLVCTALGLSPWTTAAIDEAAAEALLDLEDPSELVLYAAACGHPGQPH